MAKLAGVSQTTASFVLNDRDAWQIPDETKRRVLDAARLLGYVADPAARSLAGGRNMLLGIYSWEPVFPIDYRDFYYPFLVGIEEEAEASGYDLILFSSTSGPLRRRSVYGGGSNRLRLADGCIVLGLEHDREELRRLAQEGLTLVHIGRREIPGAPPLPYVTADYAAATAGIVGHLVGLGHRRLLYVGVLSPEEPQQDRLDGFVRGSQEAGLPGAPALRLATDEIDADRVRRWVADGCTAVVVEDGRGARAIAAAAALAGLRVPEDLSIAVLVDPSRPGDPANQWFGFRVPRVEMGRHAARLLVQLLGDGHGEAPHVVVPCDPMEGTSVATPGGGGD